MKKVQQTYVAAFQNIVLVCFHGFNAVISGPENIKNITYQFLIRFNRTYP